MNHDGKQKHFPLFLIAIVLSYGGASGKESACQCSRCMPMQQMQETQFDPWVGKIPWRKKRKPTPVFMPGKVPWGYRQSDTTQHLSAETQLQSTTKTNT